MKSLLQTISFLLVFFIGHAQNIKPEGKLIVKNPLITKLIPENPQIEILGEGFNWSEGPCWIPSENKFVFSDVKENTIFEWTEEGGIKPYLKPSGYTGEKERGGEMGSNGLIINQNGELVICQHGDRRIAKMNADVSNPKPDFVTLSNGFDGKKFNSPNDLVYAKNGDLFFTDPPYGLERNNPNVVKEMDYQGVYKIDKSGQTILLTKEISFPNGIAISVDGKKLYVSNSDFTKPLWMVYDLTADNTIENGKVFCTAEGYDRQKMQGGPDGMAVHKSGWLFASGPGGIWIITEEGEHLGIIYTGEYTSNCTFNEDYSYLYMTANHKVLRMKLK
ncbi:SMP-30/gluconolactonase/LRE family protein [Confluentibacter lentus]|uniref:SMP-30/gluconolactonase/LRE family protein n=1 Tax=Confluentibacter lentus TaxID=1699412 RepID=UPI000C28AC1F|nr:SMP-30/gluconolactonase/LRE family protein [Confluentibacter lentus]